MVHGTPAQSSGKEPWGVRDLRHGDAQWCERCSCRVECDYRRLHARTCVALHLTEHVCELFCAVLCGRFHARCLQTGVQNCCRSRIQRCNSFRGNKLHAHELRVKCKRTSKNVCV